jgi:hypothetical protein
MARSWIGWSTSATNNTDDDVGFRLTHHQKCGRVLWMEARNVYLQAPQRTVGWSASKGMSAKLWSTVACAVAVVERGWRRVCGAVSLLVGTALGWKSLAGRYGGVCGQE